MKVLVVDDELPIRTWIAAALKKITEISVQVVGIASNGREALEIFQEKKPDVVLTDIKMPILDGLSLLKKIKQTDTHAEVVILTCYEEFSYAREAVSEKAYDYILKTEITPKKLCSLLKKIEEDMQKQSSAEQWIDIQTQQEQGIAQILNSEEKLDRDAVKQILEEHHMKWKEEALFAIAFRKDGYLNEKMKSDAESIQDDRVTNLVFFPYNHKVNIAIGNIEHVPSLLYQKNVQFEFARKLSKRFQSQVGVSDLYYSYAKLKDMILQSIHTLNLEFYGFINLYAINHARSFEECKNDLDEYKTQILTELNNGKYQLAEETLEHVMEYLNKTPVYDIVALKQYFFSIITGCLVKLYMDKPQKFIEELNTCQESIQNALEFSCITKKVYALIRKISDAEHYEKSFYTSHIVKAIEYIEQNYRESCAIGEVADYIGLNSDYFSRLIKKETGMTYSQYLTNVRMNHAIMLLQNSALKVYEIAEEVGYANLGYFSKTFKKNFGVTPFEFRNKIEK